MQTGFLPSVCFISGSLVRLPIKITLLTDPISSITPFHSVFLHTISLYLSLFGIGKKYVMRCFILPISFSSGGGLEGSDLRRGLPEPSKAVFVFKENNDGEGGHLANLVRSKQDG
jgi:hypothetical protein